jgi:hypothetical protein
MGRSEVLLFWPGFPAVRRFREFGAILSTGQRFTFPRLLRLHLASFEDHALRREQMNSFTKKNFELAVRGCDAGYADVTIPDAAGDAAI